MALYGSSVWYLLRVVNPLKTIPSYLTLKIYTFLPRMGMENPLRDVTSTRHVVIACITYMYV